MADKYWMLHCPVLLFQVFISTLWSSLKIIHTHNTYIMYLSLSVVQAVESSLSTSHARNRTNRDEHVARVASPYLEVDPVLPVSLTGHNCPDLEHAVRGRQHPDVQLEELLRVVVVGQSRDVHRGPLDSHSLLDCQAGCICSLQLARCAIIHEEQDIYEPVSLAGVCNPTWPLKARCWEPTVSQRERERQGRLVPVIEAVWALGHIKLLQCEDELHSSVWGLL